MANKGLLLVDAHSLANRAFYALPPLSTSKGVPTGAIYGFFTMLFRLIEETRPKYIICAFDHPSPTFRHMEFEDYKGTRKPTPEEFRVQVPILKEALSALDMAFVELSGYEADDIIGTLACKYSEEGFQVNILSGDKDCLQLVGEGREATFFVKGTTQTRHYDRKAVKEDMGIWPEQIPDFKGLAGDQSDNIPGVRGIGAKTASKLLNEFQNLDDIYQNLEAVTPVRTRNLLKNQKQQALLSKRLATIRRDVPCEVDFQDAKWDGLNLEKAKGYFKDMEFRSLVTRLDSFEKSREGVRGVPLKQETWEAFETIDSPEKLEALAQKVSSLKHMSLYACVSDDLGPGHERFLWPLILGVSAGNAPCVIDFSRDGARDSHPYQELMWKHFGPILENPAVEKKGFDLKWLHNLCFHRGISLSGFDFDVMVAAYLLDPTRTTYRLDSLVSAYLDESMPQGIAHLPKAEKSGAEAKQAQLAHLALGAHYICALADKVKSDLKEHGLWKLAEEVEFPMIEVLASMESAGIRVDLEKGRGLRDEFSHRLVELEREAYDIAGHEFNLGSPKQLSHVLFEKLNLTPVKKTKTGYSTDAGVLETLSAVHPLPAKILEHRHYAKLKSTYLDILENVINPETGRIHSTFHQTVTATGRLSSAEPNLQNIPVRTELGRSIREIFVPAPGCLFLASDYSQIELRVMAHMSEDDSMVKAFELGQDIHKTTASEMFGVDLEEVTPELRSQAKAVNFGVIYGISEFGLARNTGVSIDEARDFMKAYFTRYPKVKEYMDDMITLARKAGYVTTILGRRRPIPDINSRNRARRGFAERTAINTPIQGSAADLIKLAMVKLAGKLSEENLKSKMILQVHDELIFEVYPEEKDYMMRIVRKEMEGVMKLRVPLKVDLKVGTNWARV